MPTSLETLLADRPWILADGATGTNLFNMGLASGEAPELWNETEPAKIRALYAGLSPEAVLAVDAPGELGRLGLDQHLSSQRSNGLRSMVARIRAIAQDVLEQA